ncbi:ABC-2 family transporter protein [Novipirellula galeiformis]|uniref:ABC-2 family transporter protein n=1 Tax=Novipirellula galeiformis TaxID=2528004 RepID=A0A5C6C3W5_9BACT|nr:ABC transporter permease subunit [Novipirellula galeiformis]TWU17479.1 ABC-2 family transporter protein [Novipirellula galeiformis]
MIDRVLLKKYIGQSLLLFLSCGLALFAFAWVRVWVVSLLDMGRFQNIVEQFRDFEKFSPIPFDVLFTYPGRVGMTYDEPIVILCIVIWCISRGSDVVSGELGRGTLEMVLSQPISRTRLLFSHAAVSVVGLALLCLLVWAGIGAGVQTTSVKETVPPPTIRIPIIEFDFPLTMGEPEIQTLHLRDRVDVRMYAAPTFHLFAFGFFLIGLATLLSSLDRYRWRTVGVTVAIYIVQTVMFGLGKAAESLQFLLSMTFLSCYKPQQMASMVAGDTLYTPWTLTHRVDDTMLPPLVYPLILIGFGVVFYIAAMVCFNRRDLPAPL